MREIEVEDYLIEQAKAIGGEVRKLRWIGRNGAPDRVIMFEGKTIWVELKRPGTKRANPHQIREHERMRRAGQTVVVIDSFEGVDKLIVEVSVGGLL
jgi:hypothetical protein